MDNNPRPKFDPETGRPLDAPPAQPAPPAEQPRPRFDPETGRPLDAPPAQPAPPAEQPRPRFDPETGRPLDAPQAQGYVPPQPGQNYTGGTSNAAPPPPAHKPFNGLALASLICGLLSLICCCCGWFSIVLGVVAVVLAILSKRDEPKMSGMALGGLICGIIGAAIALISVIINFAAATSGFLDEFFYEILGYNPFS